MTTNTILMYFRFSPDSLAKEHVRALLQDSGPILLGTLQGPPIVTTFGPQGDQLILFQGLDKSHATIRTYQSSGDVNIDVQHRLTDENNPPLNIEDLNVKDIYTVNINRVQLSEEYVKCLETKLKSHFGRYCTETRSLDAPIRRGGDSTVWPYSSFSDERLLEHDFDDVIHESHSRWQLITVAHSQQFGNVLLLDRDIMISESDLVYTQTLCCIGEEDYTGKTVLILGGGDGAILHELMKEAPGFITMAEIDEDVMTTCRTHMRSICGDALDHYEGEHHKILVDDCITVLHNNIQSGVKYDYVINDLTEFPVDKAAKGFGYDFETSSLITELSLKVVKPGGRLLARGNCLSARTFRANFEKDLTTLGCQYKCTKVHVPSFLETYCMYKVWKEDEAAPQ